MGYKQSSIKASDTYRKKVYMVGEILLYRLVRPYYISNITWKIFGLQNKLNKILKYLHEYTASFINKRRIEFLNNRKILNSNDNENL